MKRQIEISTNLFERLQKLATPFVDTPETVIERLLNHYQEGHMQSKSDQTATFENKHQISTSKSTGLRLIHTERKPDILSGAPMMKSRASRERGITISINGQRFTASSVSDLYEKALRYLCDQNYIDRIRKELPLATSTKRYLLSQSPVHPNGNEFVIPVSYGGFYMEAHKDYKNGISHLEKLLRRCGLSLEYIGN